MRRSDVDVLIAGGGLAAQRCCETLRRRGYDGRIAVLCEEPRDPYDRPPLSKTVLTDTHEPRRPAFKPGEWYAAHGVELLLDTSARKLDAATRTVTLGCRRRRAATRHAGRPGGPQHDTLRYRHLVIATGSRPRRLPGLPPGGAVHELRTYTDALALRAALRERDGPVVVLGAGLVGLEVASSARALGREVTVIEAAATPLARALPPSLGRWLAALHRERGIDVRLATSAERISLRSRQVCLQLSDASTLTADTLLLAIGTVPATEWLTGSGLGPGAIPTDTTGRTTLAGVYAAGDAACWPDPYLHALTPTQHWEAAARQGTAVAHAILRLPPPPSAPPMFWSDQHGRRIQLVGHAPPDGHIELDGDPAGGPFAAWITDHRRPAGALLVDRPDALPRARRWIAEARPASVREERHAA